VRTAVPGGAPASSVRRADGRPHVEEGRARADGRLVLQSLFALCLVSAMQLPALRDAPIGVTGASPVVNAVTSKLDLKTLA
jgi:hypothetical protein